MGTTERTAAARAATECTITPRTDEHLQDLVEVLWRVHAGGYPATWPGDPAAWLSPDGLLHTRVAIVDGRIVGHVGVAVPAGGRMPHLTRLFVDPDARGRGVADALLAEAEAVAPGTHLRLDVTEETPAAWRLYERHGWCLTGRGPADWAKPSGEVPTVRYYAKRVG